MAHKLREVSERAGPCVIALLMALACGGPAGQISESDGAVVSDSGSGGADTGHAHDGGSAADSGPATDDGGSGDAASSSDAGAPADDGGWLADASHADAGARADAGSALDGGPVADGGWWKPTNARPIHWHWQLSTDFVYPRDVLPNKTVYDLDGELTSAEVVARLHALGPEVKVICYFDAGVFEDYRSDAARFPKAVIGNPDTGWDGSYWLDIRRLDILLPIMRDRMVNWCLAKGFDAVEPDETEVWSNDPGFPITREENLAYNKAIADLAHELRLSVGLKGNNADAADLEPWFDWALTEECWQYDECHLFRDSFGAKGKAVFNVEYQRSPDCLLANQWKLNSSRRDLDLVGPSAAGYLYQPCVADSRDTW